MSIQTKPAPKETKPKVYCCECSHYAPGIPYYRDGKCNHLTNFKTLSHDWYEITRQQEIKAPKELNKNNDCKNFKSKEN